MKRAKGFTLIEVIIAVGIIGLLAGITIASMLSMSQASRARDQVRELQGFLNGARNDARNHRRCVDVTFTSSAAGTLVDADETDCASNVLATKSASLNLIQMTLGPNVSFNRRGELATPATVELIAKHKNSERVWRMRIRGMVGMTELIQ